MTPGMPHLLRRATMGAHPDRLARFEASTTREAIEQLLSDIETSEDGSIALPWSIGPPRSDDESWGSVAVWWTARLASADCGLLDRMAWIWHGWFTTSDDAFSGQVLAADHLEILYRHGMGDLRSLVHNVITSGAMLRSLDAAGSEAHNPNENLARELMELFTIGPGNYTEDDVRAAARALAGWRVNDEAGRVGFDDGAAFIAPLFFLGTQDNWDTHKILDTLVDHPSTHRRITAYLWRELVGADPSPERAAALAENLRANNLAIRPVVEQILGSPEFEASEHIKYATAVEWLVAAVGAIDYEEDLEPWMMDNLGQRPFAPPSPAGWPDGEFWARPGALLPRLQLVQHVDTDAVRTKRWTTRSLLERMGIPVDDAVAPHLDRALGDDRFDREDRQQIAWRIALTCPTFQKI